MSTPENSKEHALLLAPEQPQKLTREEAKLDEMYRVCRASGHKLTNQRVEILRELARATDHPSAETLFQRVRKRLPGVSLDTVYRTLGTFERLQLVDKLNVAHDQGRFDADRSPHHHLVCRHCKCIEDFCWEDFEQAQLPDDVLEWGEVDSRHVVVTGVCRQCRGQAQGQAQEQAPEPASQAASDGIVRKPPEGGDNA